MLRKLRSEKTAVFLFLLITFLFSFVFFTQMNPIVVFDTDDWMYIRYTRPAIPLWNDWNPCRIMPEILMHICSNFGVYVIKPFLNDYIGALSASFALALSSFICFYLYRLIRLLRARFTSSVFTALSVSTLFFLLHFLIFRHNPENNDYLFRSSDVACYFYYTIPALMNAGIVMYFLEKSRLSFKDYPSKIELGILAVGLYFGVFSNMFQTGILVSFFFIILCKKLAEKRKAPFREKISAVQIPLLVLFVWMVSLVFEFFGGRSNSKLTPKGFDLGGTLREFYIVIRNELSPMFVIIAIVIIAAFAAWLIKNRKGEAAKGLGSFALLCVICIVLTALFNVIVCAKVGKHYIQRSDVLICVFFYVFLLLSGMLCRLLNKSAVRFIMPLGLVLVFSFIMTGNRVFMESNKVNIPSDTCRKIDNYLIQQITDAEKKGQDTVKLHVPVFDTDDNWPISDYGVKHISEALYYHHVINSNIKVTFVPDKQLNEKFGLQSVSLTQK